MKRIIECVCARALDSALIIGLRSRKMKEITYCTHIGVMLSPKFSLFWFATYNCYTFCHVYINQMKSNEYILRVHFGRELGTQWRLREGASRKKNSYSRYKIGYNLVVVVVNWATLPIQITQRFFPLEFTNWTLAITITF